MFTVALRSCTVEVVTTFLPISGATVWLRDHSPHTEMAWSSVTVPLSIHGDWEPEPEPTYHAVEVRGLLFDVQFPVERFGELLPALRDHGADLYLMDRPVPATLTLLRVPEAKHASILTDNGLIARFYLPHAREVAVLSAPVRATLERWLDETALSEWLL